MQKQTNERTKKNQTNQETNKYTIVQQNLSCLIADMDRVVFFKTAAPSPQMTRYLKSQPGLGWMILGRLNVLPYLVLD